MRSEYRFVLVGRNISYSKSPDIFAAVFRHLDVEGTFEVHDIEQDEFDESLRQMILDGIHGIAVTIPYKERAAELVDDLDSVACAVNAVNSIGISEHRLYGYNTDCYGFGVPLREHSDQLRQGVALLVGYGGSARAAAYSLYTDFEIRNFIVTGRDRSRLDNFKTRLAERLDRATIETVLLSQAAKLSNSSIDIVVNCTPLGGWNSPDTSPVPQSFAPRKTKFYYDLNYNPENKNVQTFREAGAITFDGSRMLVGQAIRSFDIWTGIAVPFEPIYSAVFGRGGGSKD
jgi:shikimate dehydrogenase